MVWHWKRSWQVTEFMSPHDIKPANGEDGITDLPEPEVQCSTIELAPLKTLTSPNQEYLSLS
jgi:hypothetical protein